MDRFRSERSARHCSLPGSAAHSGSKVEFAGAARHGDGAIFGPHPKIAVHVVEGHGAIIHLKVEGGGFRGVYQEVGSPAVFGIRGRNAKIAILKG